MELGWADLILRPRLQNGVVRGVNITAVVRNGAVRCVFRYYIIFLETGLGTVFLNITQVSEMNVEDGIQ